MKEKNRNLISSLRSLSTVGNVGMTLVAATVIGLFIGLKLDQFFGTSPWLTGLFLGLGIFAGFKNLFEYVNKSRKRQDDADKKGRG